MGDCSHPLHLEPGCITPFFVFIVMVLESSNSTHEMSDRSTSNCSFSLSSSLVASLRVALSKSENMWLMYAKIFLSEVVIMS